MTTTSLPQRRRHPLAPVFAAGLLVGAQDITYACVFWAIRRDVPARRIFQSVAAGVLGEATFDGGWATASLGLALHFLIASTMALVYYLVAKRWSLLWRQAVPCGILYGQLLWLTMNYVVVPLSRAAGSPPTNSLWTWLSIVVHMLLIGLPIALFTRSAIKD
jgi:hypothetical protein